MIKCIHCQNDDTRMIEFLRELKGEREIHNIYFCHVCGKQFSIIKDK